MSGFDIVTKVSFWVNLEVNSLYQHLYRLDGLKLLDYHFPFRNILHST